MDEINYGQVATIIGRYYVMDRDKRWERVQLAYDALVDGTGEKSTNLLDTVESRYSQNETDEFFKPIINSNVDGRIKDSDVLLCFNYRSDRMREISQALGIAPLPFEGTVRSNLDITTMTRYKDGFPFNNLFPPQTMDNCLAEVLANHKIPQCHIAETEKYGIFE